MSCLKNIKMSILVACYFLSFGYLSTLQAAIQGELDKGSSNGGISVELTTERDKYETLMRITGLQDVDLGQIGTDPSSYENITTQVTGICVYSEFAVDYTISGPLDGELRLSGSGGNHFTVTIDYSDTMAVDDEYYDDGSNAFNGVVFQANTTEGCSDGRTGTMTFSNITYSGNAQNIPADSRFYGFTAITVYVD